MMTLLSLALLPCAPQGGLTPHPGWPKSFSGQGFYSPANLADLNSDGMVEMIVRSQDGGSGIIHLFHEDGSEQAGWPRDYGGNGFDGVTVAHLDPQGGADLVFTTVWAGVFGGGSIEALDIQGRDVPGWPVNPHGRQSFIMPPVATGSAVITSFIHYGNGLSRNYLVGLGPLGQPLALKETQTAPSRGAAGDLDGDGQVEAVLVSGNLLMVMDGNGMKAGWPVQLREPIGKPSLGDFTGNGLREVVVPDADGMHVFLLDGTELPGFPFLIGSAGTNLPFGQPALADLDQDGALEIVASGDNGELHAIEMGAAVPVEMPGFPVVIGGSLSDPVVGDVSGDGRPDVVLSTFHVGGSPELVAIDNLGNFTAGTPIAVQGNPGMAALGDIDGDNMTEVVLTTLGPIADFRGRLYVFDSPAVHDPNADWPLPQQDPARSSSR